MIPTTIDKQAQILEAGAARAPVLSFAVTAAPLRKLAADLRAGVVEFRPVVLPECGEWEGAMRIAMAYGIDPWEGRAKLQKSVGKEAHRRAGGVGDVSDWIDLAHFVLPGCTDELRLDEMRPEYAAIDLDLLRRVAKELTP